MLQRVIINQNHSPSHAQSPERSQKSSNTQKPLQASFDSSVCAERRNHRLTLSSLSLSISPHKFTVASVFLSCSPTSCRKSFFRTIVRSTFTRLHSTFSSPMTSAKFWDLWAPSWHTLVCCVLHYTLCVTAFNTHSLLCGWASCRPSISRVTARPQAALPRREPLPTELDL